MISMIDDRNPDPTLKPIISNDPLVGSMIPRPETVELLSSNLLPRATGHGSLRWGWKWFCDVMSTASKNSLIEADFHIFP